MDKINFRRIAVPVSFIAALFVPGVARADAGEGAFMSFAITLWRALQTSLVPYYKFDGLGIWRFLLSFLVIGLTLVWLWGWKPKGFNVTNLVGKTVGPFALIGFVIMLGWFILGMAIALIRGLLTGAIVGALSKFPVIGWFMGLFPNLQAAIAGLVQIVVGIIFLIGFIVYLAKNAGSLIKSVFDVIKGIFEGAGGAEAGMKYKIPGTLAVAAIVNRMDLNKPILFALTGLSCLLGVYVLIDTTLLGNKMKNRVAGKVLHKPEPNGDTACDNEGLRPLYDKKACKGGEHIPLLENGKPRFEKVKCGHLNVKGVKRCGHLQCSQWVFSLPWFCECDTGDKKYKKSEIPWDTLKCPKCGGKKPTRPWCCPKCGFNGTKKAGIPWSTPKCPRCKAARPPWPTSAFHYPWEDAAIEAPKPKPGEWVCTKKVKLRNDAGKLVPARGPDGKVLIVNGEKVPQKGPCDTVNAKDATHCSKCGAANPNFSGPRPPAGLLPAPGTRTKFCSNCGKGLPLIAKVCAFCGTHVAPPTPSAPAAAPAAPAATATPAVAAPTAAVAPVSLTAPRQYTRRRGHRSLSEKWR